MLLVSALPLFVLLATTVTADSIAVPIAKRTDPHGTIKPTQRDRSHIKRLLKGGGLSTSEKTADVPLDNVVIYYTASIGVGVPVTYYNLLLDTASSNTWVGANKSYKPTSTSVKTSNTFNKTYHGTNSVLTAYGNEYFDTVTISPGVEFRQSIGVALNSSGFNPYDGILGLGPRNLTLGSLSPDNTTAIPTVTDNLFYQKKIKQNLVAVSFEPTNSVSAINGLLTFGGTDSTKHTGKITYFPRTKTEPSSNYWGVDASFRYGSASESIGILSPTAGIVDAGTTTIYLATNAYDLYVERTGGVFDNATGLLSITSAQYDDLQSLFFDIGGKTYELNKNAQIWPRALNTFIGGEKDGIYLVVSDLGQLLGQAETPGFDFIVGMVFLERHYSVYDTTNNRVGFATTRFTNMTDFN